MADVRALDPDGVDVLVTGDTALFVDRLDVIGERLPWAVAFVLLAELLLLFWRSAPCSCRSRRPRSTSPPSPRRSASSCGASATATCRGVLGFTETGSSRPSQLIVIVAIAFGLSMDYEVFLLARIREEWDATGDNTAAVAAGLQRTGGIVTAAACCSGSVVGGFMLGDVTFIQMIGLGLAFALLLDATVVRALLVPATMRLLGRANWWAPAPWPAGRARYGLREEAPAARPRQAVRARVPGRPSRRRPAWRASAGRPSVP